MQMAEYAGISPGYYCGIEKNRKTPQDKELFERILMALQLDDAETDRFYDLAGRARSSVSPDLPDYIMDNDVVRYALRIARDKASAEDWLQFITQLEKK